MKKNQLVVWALVWSLTFSLNTPFSFSAPDSGDPSSFNSEDSLSNYGHSGTSVPAAAAIEPSAASISDRITLELKGVNVLDVLKILAKRSGLNIVAGRDVRGDVTLYMQDVDVCVALDTIVKTLCLAYEEMYGI